jgi:HIRAN domain-containing protein
MKPISAIVAGTRFYKPHLVGTALCRKGTQLRLLREPSNAYDANAVAVCINEPVLGLIPRWSKVGHLKAPLAARLAPKIDAGLKLEARVLSTWNRGDIEHPCR